MSAAAVVLCFLLREDSDGTSVLLGLKKTGFGTGKVVGLGGHVEPGESPAAAACREVEEESGVVVRPHDLQWAGEVRFIFPRRPEWNMDTTVYLAWSWSGVPAESDEIRPEWFPVSALPVTKMWEDSAGWLPGMLAGAGQLVTVTLNDDNQTVRELAVRD
jgi:8-oxo-dGTP diphosphatase